MPSQRLKFLASGALALLWTLIAQAATAADVGVARDADAGSSFAFYVENDLFVAGSGNEDRNYTGGFGFLFSGTFVSRVGLNRPLLALDRGLGLERVRGAQYNEHYDSLLFFGTGFTPDNLNTRSPIRDDRPYASLTGFSVSRLSVHGTDHDKAWTTDLTVAVLGLSIARNLQTKIHREARRAGDVTPYDPLGWHNQISDGGEPTLLYRATYERRLAGGPTGAKHRKHLQLSGGYQLSAGYYTDVAALANLRIGAFNSDFWGFTPGAMSVGTKNVGFMQSKGSAEGPRKWEWFFFGGLRSRLVGYNALLQGQFRDSIHTVRPKRLLLEWDAGVSIFLPRLFGPSTDIQLVWNANSGRTAEFVGSSRSHQWGSGNVVFSRGK